MLGPRLEGRVALITGGASGQGRAASVLFAEHGARIVVADLNDDGAGETIAMVDAAGSSGIALHADIARRADCDAIVDAAIAQFGRLDILYNNAAVQMSGRLVDTSEDDWDLTIVDEPRRRVLGVSRRAPASPRDRECQHHQHRVRARADRLRRLRRVRAAKAGLVALMRQIATEYGPAVRANVIAPGSIDTPRFRKVAETMPPEFLTGLQQTIPLHRLGTAEDVAGIALFLASDLSAYTTGAVIPADGGLAALR